MTKKMKRILNQLDTSDSSAAKAVYDHLTCVAENGPAYATDKSMLCEAEMLRDYAESVITQLGLSKEVK